MPPHDFVQPLIDELAERPLQREPPFGRDIGCWDQVDPGWRVVQGDELLRQHVHRAIITAPGTMFGNRDYSVDVQSFLHSTLSDTEMAARISARVRRDPRFTACGVTVTRDGLKRILDIRVTPVGSARQVAVTETVSER